MKKTIKILLASAILYPLQPVYAQLNDNLPDTKLNVDNDVEAIDMAWSGHRLLSQMIQRGNHQFIAYYDANRQMSIAHRTVLRSPWRYQKLPSFVGWDSHNYVTVDVDEKGYIHVLGNMHADPLVYFRSREPWDVRSLEQVRFMVDEEREKKVTYPRFMHDPDGRLIAIFRIGGSGNGRYYYHRYDTQAKSWALLHDKEFFNGEDERGAYYAGPDVGPDGLYHMIWVWRETPSAATNNNLSYVRSRDLINWEDSNGKPVALPIIRASGEIVDAVPVGGGLLNGQKKLGFDNNKLPMISYYKHDKNGDTQIMLARKVGTAWQSYQISDWTDSKQDLDKGGSLSVSIKISDKPYVADDGTIRVRANRDGKAIEFTVDSKNNKMISSAPFKSYPDAVRDKRDNEALSQFIAEAEGVPEDSPYNFYLSWEAMTSNQDQARGDIPAPSVLRLHKIAK